MRSGIAVGAAGWFAVAAIINGSASSGGELDVVIQAVRAVGQTLFVGLVILSLALVEWAEVRDFFLVVPPTAPAAEDPLER